VCFVCEMLKAVKPFSDCGLRKLVLTQFWWWGRTYQDLLPLQ
jgi:hypothetical protein